MTWEISFVVIGIWKLLCLCTPIGDGTKTGKSGTIYKPTSKIMQRVEERKGKEEEKSFLSAPSSVHGKPLVCSL